MHKILKFVPPSASRPETKSLPISWDMLHSELWKLAQTLQEKYPDITEAIVVTRGGLGVSCILTAMLSKVKNIETFGVTSYDATREQKGLRVLKSISVEWLHQARRRKIYVFEDVADTGVTAEFVRGEMRRLNITDYVFVAAVVKTSGKPLVDHYAISVDQDCWVDFPWDWKPVARGEPGWEMAIDFPPIPMGSDGQLYRSPEERAEEVTPSYKLDGTDHQGSD